jgi:uncharacterized protein (TIGR02757 family)
MRADKLARLRAGLDSLRERYDARYLSPDPLEFPRRFTRAEDQEVVGLVASSLAYGNVTTIRKSMEGVLTWMGSRPAQFAREMDPRAQLRRFSGFRYRWNTGKDIVCLIHFARGMMERAGSIGGFFREVYDPSEKDIGSSLARFSESVLALDHGGLYGRGRLPRKAGVRYFFPSPRSGSACKRLNMYLRWMVRRDDGLDLGLWEFVSPSRLVIPLDTHIARIGRHLGWARRKTPDWKMALEITHTLARFDPEDPTKYDFSLSRMGILKRCPRHPRTLQCDLCDLRRALRLRRRAA